jgi:aldehyde:ferredoxin oxidoreductase
MWILRVNMSDRTYSVEAVPEKYRLLGGRGITSAIVCDEVPPLSAALGPNNKLVFAPGIVTGTAAPSSSRISVGAKSPLTGTIKESNAGARLAPQLAAMRIKALIVEGQAKEKGHYWGASLSWDSASQKPKVEFFPADEYMGLNLYESYPKLYTRFGKDVQIAGIGVAGKYLYGNAGIAFNDLHGRPSRYSGRGGLGAVMGSKGLGYLVRARLGWRSSTRHSSTRGAKSWPTPCAPTPSPSPRGASIAMARPCSSTS